jgi:hypothetical protein
LPRSPRTSGRRASKESWWTLSVLCSSHWPRSSPSMSRAGGWRSLDRAHCRPRTGACRCAGTDSRRHWIHHELLRHSWHWLVRNDDHDIQALATRAGRTDPRHDAGWPHAAHLELVTKPRTGTLNTSRLIRSSRRPESASVQSIHHLNRCTRIGPAPRLDVPQRRRCIGPSRLSCRHGGCHHSD